MDAGACLNHKLDCSLIIMLGISYGELFLLLGATAALVGTKDLPMIARTAGRLAGRAVGYVQVARGQFDNVMQQSQARQVHKELQDTIAQLEAIRYEIRSISLLNPGPVTRRLFDNLDNTSATNATGGGESVEAENVSKATVSTVSIEQTTAESISAAMPSQSSGPEVSHTTAMHSQATAFARLAELSVQKAGSLQNGSDTGMLSDDVGNLNVLPISAESAGFLPSRKADVNGSDIVLEAILEAEVAHKAKDFFARPENQIEDQIKDA